MLGLQSFFDKKLQVQTISGNQTDGPVVGWNYQFDTQFDKSNCILRFQVSIKLKGLNKLRKLHRNWINNFQKHVQKNLSGKTLVVDNPLDPKCCCQKVDLKFDVQLTNGTFKKPDQKVRLKIDPRLRSNMLNWYESDPGVWLHETMQMFGVKDEYLDPQFYPNKTANDLPSNYSNGIMNNHTKPVLDRHIDDIVDRANVKDLQGCKMSTQ